MFERPQVGERAVLVQLALNDIDPQQALAEFKELAESAQAQVVSSVLGSRDTPEAKYYVGLGKAEEIKQEVQAHNADLVLINHTLAPSQERNLERLLQCRVVDRNGLILDIFAQRARTFAGKLQVELAQLQHLSTRLVRGWTHLERQKGGIGLRGPGETQLETDRRLLRMRMRFINKRLEKLRQSRAQNRVYRKKNTMPTISLVGYTNAGKSTLFNALTGANIYVANQLFATLDPTMRKIELPGASSAILIDTVGFISDLPHQLIEAFQATLEETKEADLLLHVIDIANPNWRDMANIVDNVLGQLDAQDLPIIQVFNKIDQKNWQAKVEQNGSNPKVWVSASTGAGLDLLRAAIATQLQGVAHEEDLYLTHHDAKLRATLYNMHAIISEIATEEGWSLKIKLTPMQKQLLLRDL